ncbi:hypothetical protein, partial [Aggregatibacter actinomycetemcomitans]|uniref:hypothetical protein n=1 Tax=Aggregatibacter actinomycetemcomitans TaxID=714 RepID=UPI001E4B69D0
RINSRTYPIYQIKFTHPLGFFDEKFYFCDSASNIHFRRFYASPISSIVAALRMIKVRLKM